VLLPSVEASVDRGAVGEGCGVAVEFAAVAEEVPGFAVALEDAAEAGPVDAEDSGAEDVRG
jgi:hypothetical protein